MNENSVEGKPCINRESKSNELTIYLYRCHDINIKFLVVITPPSIYQHQQKISFHHTDHSEQKITPSLTFSSHETRILNFSQKNETMKHSLKNSYFILLNIKPSPRQKHQNSMSKSLHTWIMTMDLNFLLMMYFKWVPN